MRDRETGEYENGDGKWADLWGGAPVAWDQEMKCPTCSQNTPDSWNALDAGPGQVLRQVHGAEKIPGKGNIRFTVEWMLCANEECGETVIRLNRSDFRMAGDAPLLETLSVIVWPRTGGREPVDPTVPRSMVEDYQEAAAILDLSPRMSAVLARSILADLLERYAGHTQFSLTDRIDAFNKQPAHPRTLRENLHHFREIADLGAHKKTSDHGQIIKIERAEADWTLDLVQRLFDHLIATPAADKKMRDAIDGKLKAADRKPIKPLPNDPA